MTRGPIRGEIAVKNEDDDYDFYTGSIDLALFDVNEISLTMTERGNDNGDAPFDASFYVDAVGATMLANRLLKLAREALPPVSHE